MARWLALMAIVAVSSGCSLKYSTGMQPNYDLTDYETYDQPHATGEGEIPASMVVSSLPEEAPAQAE